MKVSLLFPLLVVLAAAAPGRPEVDVVRPVVREVADYEDFTGRTDASEQVQLRPRVTGYINRVTCKVGDAVQKGDLLFQLDPRPYEARLKKAEADVVMQKARLKRADAAYQRGKALEGAKGTSREELATLAADRTEAQARLRVAEAGIAIHKLNLAFTRVNAPISGRVGRGVVNVGNLVVADKTDLATLFVASPLYVYFEIDERTLLRLRREGLVGEGKKLPVAVQLADESGYPHKGEVDSAAGRVNPRTGTARLRAVLPNKGGVLTPGLFVKVRLTTGKPRKALLLPRRMNGKTLSRGKELLTVVNAQSQLERREVGVGLPQGDWVEVTGGLRPGEWVVSARGEKLKEGTTVRPKKVSADKGK
jgi:RND family efflux transporter MFP subunit